MKTVVVLASLIALALADSIVVAPKEYKTKSVDNEFVIKQQKILSLYYHTGQVNTEAEYFKIGKDYDIEAHIGDYTNQAAVQESIHLWKTGFLPKNLPFSIFNERSKQEAIGLFHVFYYAKDFDVFYKTAACARVYANEGQFLYAYYIAVLHRPDTRGIVLPAPYEAFPELFTNVDTWYRVNRIKMQNGIENYDFGPEYGVVKELDKYVVYANYSNHFTYPDNEHKISYFTEDIGLNAYYYYFHVFFPFWMESDIQPALKEHRGEIYYNFYQQFLARYYLERLSSHIGEIPEFSWTQQIQTGYKPSMKYFYNFVQRPDNYQVPYDKHIKEIEFLQSYEQTFIYYLQQGHFKAFNQEIDLHNSKSLNFVGNFWQGNWDFFTKVGPWSQPWSYEHIARNVLGASVETLGKYEFAPTALDFYQTSVRDPAFYQLYSKIMKYVLAYKNFLTPYNQESLHFVGVKITDVKVDKLVTYFDYYDFEVSNNVYYTKEELKSNAFPFFYVRQPRINHKVFNVNIDVKSDVEGDAVVKIFIGPKYDSRGYIISLEDNWQNFVELDWSIQKLIKGQNKIIRNSNDFYYVKEDSTTVREIVNMVSSGKVPIDMSVKPGAFPSRLILPKGTYGGFPFQLFVVIYPYEKPSQEFEFVKVFAMDNKPLGYPFDRPINDIYFKQPNMFFEDIKIYHEGEIFPYEYNVPYYTAHYNEVNKH